MSSIHKQFIVKVNLMIFIWPFVISILKVQGAPTTEGASWAAIATFSQQREISATLVGSADKPNSLEMEDFTVKYKTITDVSGIIKSSNGEESTAFRSRLEVSREGSMKELIDPGEPRYETDESSSQTIPDSDVRSGRVKEEERIGRPSGSRRATGSRVNSIRDIIDG
ncbi:hypothetical protein CROQUDRAFT_88949 [Cronartium quercuum f. sp. fusiforme G11]|uniref:Uncharacterized protein n=1 Tax=Cronartium quercuum f. sp. fusiforme G11 TaxID=708437 RepID=A0A9P6NP41_9BASI|nr:hypothetical protein CROQUDRAFT_88949 [Cronartium quercuum f. sp. fusiforme G11]